MYIFIHNNQMNLLNINVDTALIHNLSQSSYNCTIKYLNLNEQNIVLTLIRHFLFYSLMFLLVSCYVSQAKSL